MPGLTTHSSRTCFAARINSGVGLMLTSAQLLESLSVAAVLLVAYGYATRGDAGRRLASTVLPGVFILQAGWFGSNVFYMLSNVRGSIRRYSSPHAFSSYTFILVPGGASNWRSTPIPYCCRKVFGAPQ